MRNSSNKFIIGFKSRTAATISLTLALIIGLHETSAAQDRLFPVVPSFYGVGAYALEVSDLNEDGHMDLVGEHSGGHSDGVTVLLGNGDGTFDTLLWHDTGSSIMNIATGDFDDDGHIDVAACHWRDSNISVLLGNGDGTLQEAVNYVAGVDRQRSIVTGDFDGDGHTDLAVSAQGDLGERPDWLSILLGNGDGTFQSPTTYSIINYALGITSADFNEDGRGDLAVPDPGVRSVSVLLSNGDGSFETLALNSVGERVVDVTTSDFNADGHTDLAVGTEHNGVAVLLGSGDGTFQPAVTYETAHGSENVTTGDFNGDGHVDLAATSRQSFDVSVLLGNGDGTFQPAVSYVVGEYPGEVATGDFDEDGYLDLAVGKESGRVAVLLGNGDGTFPAKVNYRAGISPRTILTDDFDRDGHADLAVTNAAGSSSTGISLFLGNGDGTLGTAEHFGPPDARDVATGDFDENGHPDLVLTVRDSRDLAVLLGNGDGSFQAASYCDAGPDPTGIETGDFDEDGHTDVVVTNGNSNELVVLLGNGDGTFQPALSYAAGYAPYHIGTGDFNEDGHTDVAVQPADSFVREHRPGETYAIWALLGNGDGTFQPALNYYTEGDALVGVFIGTPGMEPGYFVGREDVTTGDFNGDGYTDVTRRVVGVFIGNRDGLFERRGGGSTGLDPYGVTSVDLNEDGQDDLAVCNTRSDCVTVLLSNPSPDTDADGLLDRVETGTGTYVDETDTGTDPDDADTDDDGLSDSDEVNSYGTDPVNADSDSDTMPDGWETQHGLDPIADDGAGDPDRDGLSNSDEYAHGTDPLSADTDGDGASDWREVFYVTDPVDRTDEPSFPYVDVNGTRRVDAVDIQLVINELLGLPTGYICDVDDSGSVDTVDIQLVINATLGLAF